ncbi:hypothetical protein BDF14DRAFT_1857892, partial [Spinellus fusiger]
MKFNDVLIPLLVGVCIAGVVMLLVLYLWYKRYHSKPYNEQQQQQQQERQSLLPSSFKGAGHLRRSTTYYLWNKSPQEVSTASSMSTINSVPSFNRELSVPLIPKLFERLIKGRKRLARIYPKRTSDDHHPKDLEVPPETPSMNWEDRRAALLNKYSNQGASSVN